MESRLTSGDTLVKALLPEFNPDPASRDEAWAVVIAEVKAELLAYIRSRNHTGEDHEELFDDTICTALYNVQDGQYSCTSDTPFVAYLKGIAKNKIREAARRAARIAELGLEEIPQSARGFRRVEELVEHNEQRDELASHLQYLPALRRQVLEFVWQGWSIREIAAYLAISEAAVRQHKSRGLRQLQDWAAGA